ncbi:TPA: hypothetical protein QFK82_000943 [Enterococcus faecium]
MIEVTNTYGFDDWFINQETDTTVTSFDDATEGIEQSKTDGKGLNESHAKAM